MSGPQRRRLHLWFVGLLAGLIIGYPAIVGPVVYMGARGWLPKEVSQAFCLPLYSAIGTPLARGVGDYLEWWGQMATRPSGTLAYDSDLRIAIAAFLAIAASTLVYWSRTRPKLRSGICGTCGRIIQVRSFRVYSRAWPPSCSTCTSEKGR